MWIDTIPYEQSEGALRKVYDRVSGPGDRVDNILQAHSLRPHTLRGHMALYKSVLHHSGNRLPVWLLETIGIYVSHLNGCGYCFDHHVAGLTRLVGDERSEEIVSALEKEAFEPALGPVETAALTYAQALTTSPKSVDQKLINVMRAAHLTDGEILEINQVVAYFAYANRVVNGLGVTSEGDALGLSPDESDNTEDWGHG